MQTLPAWDDAFGDEVGKVAGLLRASCPSPFGPAFGCSKLLLAILSSRWISWRTSVCATLRATCGRANRLSCRFVIARLAALVPKPRVNLTRIARIIPDTRPLRGPAEAVQIHSRWIFHGVFAPNSQHRALVTPAMLGRGNKPQATDDSQEPTPAERRAAMSWAQRLMRVFGTDIATCPACGGALRIIAYALRIRWWCPKRFAGQALEKIPSLGP